MFPPRFSLRRLLACVAVVAIGLAALEHSSFLFASLVFSVVVALLTAAIPNSLFSVNQRRIFWFGFAVFGWLHLIMPFVPWWDDTVGQMLFSRLLLDWTGQWFGITVVEMDHEWSVAVGSPRYKDYLLAGHSLISLLVAYAGGLIAVWFSDKRAAAEQLPRVQE